MVILDLMLPGMSGYDVLAELRARPETRDIGVILLTARKQEADRIRGLTLGADDYLTKPFSPAELTLRVGAVLRRLAAPSVSHGDTLTAGDITIDRSALRVTVDGRELELTATEYKLLLTLIERRGRVQTRPQLLETVWEAQPDIQTRTVDMHVQRLRTKLGDAGRMIETVRGFGYRFRAHGPRRATRVTFAGRVVAGTLAVLVVSVLVLLWTADLALRRDLEDEVAAHPASARRRSSARASPPSPTAAQARIHRIARGDGLSHHAASRRTARSPARATTPPSPSRPSNPTPPAPRCRAALADSVGCQQARRARRSGGS